MGQDYHYPPTISFIKQPHKWAKTAKPIAARDNKEPGGRIRVFVFDDEPVVRSMLKRICLRRGYEVHTFSRPDLCAKCRCKKGEACTDIVISDIKCRDSRVSNFLPISS